MRALDAEPRLAAVVDDFRLGSPAQELLDRFLVGIAPAGEIAAPARGGVVVHARDGVGAPDLARRAAEFGVAVAGTLVEAVAFARAILFVPADPFGRAPDTTALEDLLEAAPRGARVFITGRLGRDASGARRILELGAARGLSVAAAGYMPFTWRLPAVDVAHEAALTHAVVVVGGNGGAAGFHGLDALLALAARRAGGEKGVTAITARAGGSVWPWLDGNPQVRALLAAAISRSNSPQGDALADGRTQDLMRLGLLPRLAREPVAYEIEHAGGLKSALFVLEGAIADSNFAVRESSGRMTSAQLYLPPSPGFHFWTALARRVDAFLFRGEGVWPDSRMLLLDGLLAALEPARGRAGTRHAVDGLTLSYPAPVESRFER